MVIEESWAKNVCGAVEGSSADGLIPLETAYGSNQYPNERIGGVPITGIHTGGYNKSHFHYEELVHGGPNYDRSLVSNGGQYADFSKALYEKGDGTNKKMTVMERIEFLRDGYLDKLYDERNK